MDSQQTDILIIGAGLTGLTTGFWLTRAGKDIHILEKADRVGGQIHTFRENDFIYESGPNTGVVSYPEVAELSKPSPLPVHWRLPAKNPNVG